MAKLILERDNGIARIVINRPEIHNAVDYDVMDGLKEMLDEIERTPEDKLVVIRGAGTKSFCSGGDLSIFHELHTKEEAYAMLEKMGELLFRFFFFSKPTIAAINGTAVGGGMEIASACDFRLADEHAKVGFIQGKLGITTGWGGGTMIQHRMNQANAMQMLMSAHKYIAEEAKILGFVQEIMQGANFDQKCNEWLAPFLRQSTAVLSAYKKRWNDSVDRSTIKKRMQREHDECSTLWATDAHHKAVNTFLAKKKPN